jgi:tetratricopeptide (TPR) repeat protein
VLCKKIKRRGGAEQYNADNKCKEAIAEAVEACAEDTAGQTCYICTEAVHWKTKEGLVRMCACRGTAGFAHVSCLAEQAKLLMDEALENNLDDKFDERWNRWVTCSLCEQQYHLQVLCALGWACWKTYADRSENKLRQDQVLRMESVDIKEDYSIDAMALLGVGLLDNARYDEAATVLEAFLDTAERLWIDDEGNADDRCYCILADNKTHLAHCYSELGRHEEAYRMQSKNLSVIRDLYGDDSEMILYAAERLAVCMVRMQQLAKAKRFLKNNRRVDLDTESAFRVELMYASMLCGGDGDSVDSDSATLDELVEALNIFETVGSKTKQLLGDKHILTQRFEGLLPYARVSLAERCRF